MSATSEDNVDVARRVASGVAETFERHIGEKPASVRPHMAGDHVSVFVEEALSAAERDLVQHGARHAVLQLRWEVQDSMRKELTAVVERETGRPVRAFLSANHVDPDMAVVTFVLDASPNGDSPQASS